MLSYLSVQNLGIIRDLEINFTDGFNVLTGETGAGKTLLVEALAIISGAKSSQSAVGPFGQNALVEAEFIDGRQNKISLVRSIGKTGKSRCWVNSESVPLQEFATIGANQVEIFSQHASLKLLKPSYISEVLDRFAGLKTDEERGDLRFQLKEATQNLRKVEVQLTEIETGRLSLQEVEFYKIQLHEILSANIVSAGELDELINEQEILADSQRIIEGLSVAKSELAADDNMLQVDTLTALKNAIDQLNSLPNELTADYLQRLDDVRIEVSEIAFDLGHLKDKLAFDSERLENINQRIQLLKSLTKKYGGTLEAVLGNTQRLREMIDLGKNSQDQKDYLLKEKAKLMSVIQEIKAKITSKRIDAAKFLKSNILNHLADLSMPQVKFEIVVDGAESGDVDFLISTNVSMPLGSVSKIASGGELSRIMLAINLSLKENENYTIDGSALVFDEVDAGIGGQTALNIGLSLAKLAREEQIFVVTHLPQVAAFADNHFMVLKSNSDVTQVEVFKLDEDSRVEEINRMLSGVVGTQSGLAHAKELISQAQILKNATQLDAE